MKGQRILQNSSCDNSIPGAAAKIPGAEKENPKNHGAVPQMRQK
jgi:hypothetical protein